MDCFFFSKKLNNNFLKIIKPVPAHLRKFYKYYHFMMSLYLVFFGKTRQEFNSNYLFLIYKLLSLNLLCNSCESLMLVNDAGHHETMVVINLVDSTCYLHKDLLTYILLADTSDFSSMFVNKSSRNCDSKLWPPMRANLVDVFFLLKVINNLMLCGKKNKMHTNIDFLLFQLRNNYRQNPLLLLHSIIKKISLAVRLKKIRIAGRIYLMPLFVAVKRQVLLGIKLFVYSVRLRNEYSLINKLVFESKAILDNNSVSSFTIKKRNETYKSCIENKFYLKHL